MSHSIVSFQQQQQILPTPSHLGPSFWVTPFQFIEKLYGSWN